MSSSVYEFLQTTLAIVDNQDIFIDLILCECTQSCSQQDSGHQWGNICHLPRHASSTVWPTGAVSLLEKGLKWSFFSWIAVLRVFILLVILTKLMIQRMSTTIIQGIQSHNSLSSLCVDLCKEWCRDHWSKITPSFSLCHKILIPATPQPEESMSGRVTAAHPSPTPPCRPSSLHGLCSQRGGTTEKDSRPQSGWAKSTIMARLLACLHIVQTSAIKGNHIFIPSEFFLQTAVLVKKDSRPPWLSKN